MEPFSLFNSSFLTTKFFWKVKLVVDIDVLSVDGVIHEFINTFCATDRFLFSRYIKRA